MPYGSASSVRSVANPTRLFVAPTRGGIVLSGRAGTAASTSPGGGGTPLTLIRSAHGTDNASEML
jgi:hypothetical protein